MTSSVLSSRPSRSDGSIISLLHLKFISLIIKKIVLVTVALCLLLIKFLVCWSWDMWICFETLSYVKICVHFFGLTMKGMHDGVRIQTHKLQVSDFNSFDCCDYFLNICKVSCCVCSQPLD